MQYAKQAIFALFILLSTFGYSQTFNYSYTDPCTGVTKTMQVPSNGVTVTYYGQINTFQPADFYNGSFETWSQGVFSSFGNNNPCATVIGLPTALNVAQSSALNVLGVMNSLSAISDMASIANGATNILGGVNSIGNSSGNGGGNKKDDKKNEGNSTGSTSGSNNSGSAGNNSGNSSGNPATGSGSQVGGQVGSGTQNNGTGGNGTNQGTPASSGSADGNSNSPNANGNGSAGSNGQSGSNTSGTNNTQPGSGQPAGGTTVGGSNNTGTNGSNNTNGNTGSTSGSQGGSQPPASGGTTGGTGGTTGSSGGTTSGSNNSTTGGSQTSESPVTSDEGGGKTNILGGSVTSIGSGSGTGGSGNSKGAAAASSKNGNRPSILASSDLVGFSFNNSDVSKGFKASGGYTSMRWDGQRSHGFLVDYTSALKGPNATAFYANIKKKRIDLISGTVTIGLDVQKSLYGTLAVGQMWNLTKKKNVKAVYMFTGSYGNVYGVPFIGTAAIAGAMWDVKIGKRFDIKLMGLYVYAPYVSYYNDILLKSPHVVLPIIGTNIGITKRFKININGGGAWALQENALNYTIMMGTRVLL